MTLQELTNAIEGDIVWRRREIFDLFDQVAPTDPDSDLHRALTRASVALSYAHWEGFVKHALEKYFEHLGASGLTFKKLRKEFLWTMSFRETEKFSGGKKPLQDHVGIVQNLLDLYDSCSPQLFEGAINTQSNLKEKVFDGLCLTAALDIDKELYPMKTVCNELVHRRNEIAHGKAIFVTLDDVRKYRDDVLSACSQFTYDVLKAASTKAYLAAAQ